MSKWQRRARKWRNWYRFWWREAGKWMRAYDALLAWRRQIREARREDYDFNASDTVEVSREWLDRVMRAIEGEAGKEEP